MFPTWNQIVQVGQTIQQGFQDVVDWFSPGQSPPQPAPAPQGDAAQGQSHYSTQNSALQALRSAASGVVRTLAVLASVPLWQETLLVTNPSAEENSMGEVLDTAAGLALFFPLGPVMGPLAFISSRALSRSIQQYLSNQDGGVPTDQPGQQAGDQVPVSPELHRTHPPLHIPQTVPQTATPLSI